MKHKLGTIYGQDLSVETDDEEVLEYIKKYIRRLENKLGNPDLDLDSAIAKVKEAGYKNINEL